MVEPISDDKLQRLRDRLLVMDGPAYAEMPSVYVTKVELRGVLARLDAAESRAAELQREVERLRYEITERNEMICQGCRGHAMDEQEDGSAICEECGFHSTMNQSIGIDPC